MGSGDHGVERPWGGLLFRTMQILTDHGCFGHFLFYIRRQPSADYHHCGAMETSPSTPPSHPHLTRNVPLSSARKFSLKWSKPSAKRGEKLLPSNPVDEENGEEREVMGLVESADGWERSLPTL
ncbi:hypothetical protein KM043_016624 [Ampulex compressa]|nr:hypothetical protein KM043_016624 [Ampulex compressa]